MNTERTVYIDEDNWMREVIDAETPVLVDFGAEWCGPCRTMEPILEELADEYGPRFKVAKVDVEVSPELASEYGIRSVPTLVVVSEGREEERIVGTITKHELSRKLASYLDAA